MTQFEIFYFGQYSPTRYDGLVGSALESLFDTKVIVSQADKNHPNPWSFNGREYDDIFNQDFFIIQDRWTHKFVVIDEQDSCGFGPGYKLASDPNHIGSWFTMYNPKWIADKFPDLYQKAHPAYFLDMQPGEVDEMYGTIRELRKKHIADGTLDDRLYWSGTQKGLTPDTEYDFRDVAVILKEQYPDEVRIEGEKLPRPEWWKQAAGHRLNLALPGHPWCSREHELWHFGLPIMMYELQSYVLCQPIPNVDYVSVSTILQKATGVAYDAVDAARRIMDRHRASRGLERHLEWIGERGRMHYVLNLNPEEIARRLAKQIKYVFQRT